jgi:hypothetical protein
MLNNWDQKQMFSDADEQREGSQGGPSPEIENKRHKWVKKDESDSNKDE